MVLDGGRELGFDVLVVAVGAVGRSARAGRGELRRSGPGRRGHRDPRQGRAGELRRLVFAVPGETTWSLPVYELAMMAAADLRARGVEGATLGIATAEPEPLGVFGPAAGAALREMLDARRIALWTRSRPLVRAATALLVVEPGPPLRADAVISVPGLHGLRARRVCRRRADSSRSTPTGGSPELPASMPPATLATFPVKQGGLATQQADAVAESVAADLGLRVRRRRRSGPCSAACCSQVGRRSTCAPNG